MKQNPKTSRNKKRSVITPTEKGKNKFFIKENQESGFSENRSKDTVNNKTTKRTEKSNSEREKSSAKR